MNNSRPWNIIHILMLLTLLLLILLLELIMLSPLIFLLTLLLILFLFLSLYKAYRPRLWAYRRTDLEHRSGRSERCSETGSRKHRRMERVPGKVTNKPISQ